MHIKTALFETTWEDQKVSVFSFIKITTHLLTFTVCQFKCHIYCCGWSTFQFSCPLWDSFPVWMNDVHLMEQHCPVCLLKIKVGDWGVEFAGVNRVLYMKQAGTG